MTFTRHCKSSVGFRGSNVVLARLGTGDRFFETGSRGSVQPLLLLPHTLPLSIELFIELKLPNTRALIQAAGSNRQILTPLLWLSQSLCVNVSYPRPKAKAPKKTVPTL